MHRKGDLVYYMPRIPDAKVLILSALAVALLILNSFQLARLRSTQLRVDRLEEKILAVQQANQRELAAVRELIPSGGTQIATNMPMVTSAEAPLGVSREETRRLALLQQQQEKAQHQLKADVSRLMATASTNAAKINAMSAEVGTVKSH